MNSSGLLRGESSMFVPVCPPGAPCRSSSTHSRCARHQRDDVVDHREPALDGRAVVVDQQPGVDRQPDVVEARLGDARDVRFGEEGLTEAGPEGVGRGVSQQPANAAPRSLGATRRQGRTSTCSPPAASSCRCPYRAAADRGRNRRQGMCRHGERTRRTMRDGGKDKPRKSLTLRPESAKPWMT